MVTLLPFNVRRAVRDTSIQGYFIPEGTNINLWPGMNYMLPELWDNPRSSTERFAEPRSEHKAAPLRLRPFGGVRIMHRAGLRTAGDQIGHAPGAAELPAGTAASGLHAALCDSPGCRSPSTA